VLCIHTRKKERGGGGRGVLPSFLLSSLSHLVLFLPHIKIILKSGRTTP